jgi:hypothetical protein
MINVVTTNCGTTNARMINVVTTNVGLTDAGVAQKIRILD